MATLRPGQARPHEPGRTSNQSGEEWGWPRFLKTVEDSADQRAQNIVETVMQTAEAFAGGAPPHDDVTLFVGRVQDVVAHTPRWKTEYAAAPVAA